MSLKGKTAVVTGASRGIGRAIAARLAADGALVCINYRNDAEAAKAAVGEVERAGGSAFAIKADVGSLADVEKFFADLDTELKGRGGDGKFDILVNNAGVAEGGTVSGTTEAAFDKVFAVNVKGPFFVTQHALPRLRDGGRIINVASNLARRPMAEFLAYCMTKAALDIFTQGLAGELGRRGITVNTLAPGLTATDMNAALLTNPGVERAFSAMTALGRVGTVEEVAAAASLLASPDAAWVTGQYFEASGGLGLVSPMAH